MTQIRQPVDASGPSVLAVQAELVELGKSESALGAQALVLAARLDGQTQETGAALAAVSRELRAVMAEARMTAKPASAIDMLRDRRDAKRAGAG